MKKNLDLAAECGVLDALFNRSMQGKYQRYIGALQISRV